MKIVAINGTAVKGVTAYMKQLFLEKLSGTHEIIEFYPKDFPPFCTGCKNCFSRGKAYCPHAHEVSVIWQAITKADLLVFAYPVYALRVPASIKSLLDHFCVHWMVHRPEPRLFEKTAVILTNSIGASNQAAQNDVRTSLSWMGVSRIYRCGAGMMGDIMVDHLSIKHQKMLTKKTGYLARKVASISTIRKQSIEVRLKFWIAKKLHEMILKTESVPSIDNQYYIDRGWIKKK